MRRNLTLFATVFAVAFGVALLLLLRHGAVGPATPEAEKIVGDAERMAVSPDLSDPAKIAAEFDLPLELSVRGHRPTRCPGHPIQLSEGWELPNHRSAWFVKDGLERPQPLFMLQLEPQPEVCPGDPANLPIVARFGEVQAWRCIHMPDLGPIASRYKMLFERPGSHVEGRDIRRPEGRKAHLDLIFLDHHGGKDGCLFSVTVTVRDS